MTYDFATSFHCLNVLEPATASYLRLSIELLAREREEIRAIEDERKRKRLEKRLTKLQGEKSK